MARHAVVVDQPENRDERIQEQKLDQRLRHGAAAAKIFRSAPPHYDREQHDCAHCDSDEPSVIARECSCSEGDAASFEPEAGVYARRPDRYVEIRKTIAEKII